MSLAAKCWSPVPGDQLLAIEHERDGDERPAIWDLETGERHDLELEPTGDISVEGWWPDGSALLLNRPTRAGIELLRYDAADRRTASVATSQASSGRPASGLTEGCGSSTSWERRQRVIRDDSGSEALALGDEEPAEGQPYETWHFTNPHGDRVHGFYVTPDDSGGPLPVVMFVHGGPTWLDSDRWQPDVQALVDAGFAVAMVNYRGSTGYGREWRDTLIGDIGGPELEDVNAGLQDLVERGIADASARSSRATRGAVT